MFRIEILPAKHGDAIIVEYGKGQRHARILIDGGPTNAAKAFKSCLSSLPLVDREFELLVITHVDTDHIEGIIRLLRSKDVKPKVREVWFNGWKHLSDKLGPVQGEYLTGQIEMQKIPWNTMLKGRAVMVPDTGKLQSVPLPGGMQLTILSPDSNKLEKLRKVWKKVVEEAGLVPGVSKKALTKLEKAKGLGPLDRLGDWVAKYAESSFTADDSEANGSSIAFLAEYDGASCLFLGDAHPDMIEDSLKRLIKERRETRLRVDAVKLSHHGSKNNLNPDILKLIRCTRYIVSTNGDKFGHPDIEAISRVIKYGGPSAEIYFNYPNTKKTFGSATEMKRFGYKSVYPKTGTEGIVIEL